MAELRSTKQALEKSTKKALQLMTAEVTEAQQAQQRAESECNSLRDSVRSLREVWAREVKTTRQDWKRDMESERIAREGLVSWWSTVLMGRKRNRSDCLGL